MNEIKELDKLYNNMDVEYYYIVKEILEHNEFIKRLNYNHHENRSVFVHSLMVSTLSYKIEFSSLISMILYPTSFSLISTFIVLFKDFAKLSI